MNQIKSNQCAVCSEATVPLSDDTRVGLEGALGRANHNVRTYKKDLQVGVPVSGAGSNLERVSATLLGVEVVAEEGLALPQDEQNLQWGKSFLCPQLGQKDMVYGVGRPKKFRDGACQV